jgi:acetaldehyde dehydrogenase (acetylating)
MSNSFDIPAVAVGGPTIRWNVSDNVSNTGISVAVVWLGGQCSRPLRAAGGAVTRELVNEVSASMFTCRGSAAPVERMNHELRQWNKSRNSPDGWWE